jgi:LmbE family N-acetylglucosaminyl deacetylase
MEFIYFSPHLDDVILSCGGLIWQQVQEGHRVHIWTLCAGDPTAPLSNFARELHRRWGVGADPVAARRQEDIQACGRLTAEYRHFPIPDCIYRVGPISGTPLYPDEGALFGDLSGDEEQDIENWSEEILIEIPCDAFLVCPLAVGGHVDHKLTRRVVEQFGRPLSYYADYPYAATQHSTWKELVPKGYQCEPQVISPEALRIWQHSIAAYGSQISTFWLDNEAMALAIRDHLKHWGGIPIWKSV